MSKDIDTVTIEVLGLGQAAHESCWRRKNDDARKHDDEKPLYAKVQAKCAGKVIQRLFAAEELGETGMPAVFKWLASRGLVMHDAAYRRLIAEAVAQKLRQKSTAAPPVPLALVADRRGWCGGHFVTHFGVHSPANVELWTTGTLKFKAPPLWTPAEVAPVYDRLGRGNAAVKFCVCASFVGPLLHLLERREHPCIVLVGPPGAGKSSLLQVLAATWGGRGDGILGHVESISATVNKLELTIAAANDMACAYDDLQPLKVEQRGGALRDIIHRLSGGRTKDRMTDAAVSFRAVVFVASNDPVATVMRRSGIIYDEPTSSRVIEVDCQYEHGVFQKLPPDISAKGFAEEMASTGTKLAGVPGEQFAARLVADVAKSRKKLVAKLTGLMQECEAALVGVQAEVKGGDGRQLAMFSLVYAGGVLAGEYGIHGWSKERVLNAVKQVFDRHRGVSEARRNDNDPKTILARYIKRHLHDFVRIGKAGGRLTEDRIRRARGIVLGHKPGPLEYAFLSDQLAKAFGGQLPSEKVLKQLERDGYLRPDGKKLQVKVKLTDGFRPRLYCFKQSILNGKAAVASVEPGKPSGTPPKSARRKTKTPKRSGKAGKSLK